ncbi:DUF4193 domain-containing protein [Pseudarthrobacter sp. S9]|uniref:DUF4193 domain-containing protein n=1 Tax=Pseudarthrobacter sp. S9 TaxID=3418421 RepID=UPI003D046E21
MPVFPTSGGLHAVRYFSNVQGKQGTAWQPITTSSDARSVVRELDETDGLEGAESPGGEFIAEELTLTVIPQKEDEFTCYSCFLVRHRSQLARERNGHPYCRECEG